MDALETLESNLHLLLERYQVLAEENKRLLKEKEEQRGEIMQTHAELVELQKRYKHLQVAHAMTASSDEREKAYQRLSGLIAKVDAAIDVLKE